MDQEFKDDSRVLEFMNKIWGKQKRQLFGNISRGIILKSKGDYDGVRLNHRPFDKRRSISYRSPLCGFVCDLETGAVYSSRRTGFYSNKLQTRQLRAELIDENFHEQSIVFCNSIDEILLEQAFAESFQLIQNIVQRKAESLKRQSFMTSEFITNLCDWSFFISKTNFIEFGMHVTRVFPEQWKSGSYYLQRELQLLIFPKGVFHVWEEDRLLFPYSFLTPYKTKNNG